MADLGETNELDEGRSDGVRNNSTGSEAGVIALLKDELEIEVS